ncbi:MAG: HAD family hydrolase [Oscillospiraceae bacterium]|nr:HAD family hydrolase [Oscillospiraceae bacterium]
MLFLSDLDNTLIFSYKKLSEKDLCVEKKDGKNLSYMTYRSAELFSDIVRRVTFIPVTTRSAEQYGRISFPEGYIPKYAVIDNGANLLINGEPDKQWRSEVIPAINESLPEIRECEKYLQKCGEVYFDIRFVDDSFLFTKCHDSERVMHELFSEISPAKTRLFTNGDKLYAIPDGISKKNALERLKRRLSCELIIAAGDSLFDEDMLSAADLAIVKYGELCGKRINPRQLSEERESDPDFVLSCLADILNNN